MLILKLMIVTIIIVYLGKFWDSQILERKERMKLEIGGNYSNFKLIEEKFVKEINGVGRLFIHENSGAQLYNIENNDDNKVFSISFRTPPEDSTGLPHILEHSVLCGSRKFPTKEPFVELAKGSLNTFLNAMTFPDKTMYPIASKNKKDFLNLMDVYLDAVFFPAIYVNPNILKQEGWHYEIYKPEDDISYKGVVYNEMKGAFSQPESVLFRKIQEHLYPDTPYGFESGGDPEFIPNLTQEQFLKFHKKYYHPSNSYIYIYGDGNILEYLEFLDREYLSNFSKDEVFSEINFQTPFSEPKEFIIDYPISKGEKEEEKSFLSLSYSVGKSTDGEICLAFDILNYLLLQTDSAPLKRALIQAELGKDVVGSFDNSILQPIFSIIVKNSNLEKKEEFKKVVFNTLKRLVSEGIDKKLIQAAINIYEFQLREADHGSYPKGLIYGIQIMDSWLYGSNPRIHLEYESTLNKIKTALNTNYFEKLIEKYILNNNHSIMMIVKPKKGMAELKEKEVQRKLTQFKSSLTKKEVEKLIEEAVKLRKIQMTPDSKEELNKIPLLSIDDIEKEVEKIPIEEKKEKDIKVLFHPLFTNGIIYMNLYFDIDMVPENLIPYISLLSQLLGKLDTKTYNYIDLSNEVNTHTGGIQYRVEAFSEKDNDDIYHPKFIIKSRALIKKLPQLNSLLNDIMINTQFSDDQRIKEIIQETKSRIEKRIQGQGHLVVANRIYSYFSPLGHYLELLNGIEYYKFLSYLEKNYEQKVHEIKENLIKISKMIFNKNILLISLTSENKHYEDFKRHLPSLIENFNTSSDKKQDYKFDLSAKNEGLLTSSEVQYVGKGYNFKKLDHSYSGTLQVLKTILSYDYLWNNIRVRGGAYGAFFNISRDGNVFLGSYRDPNLIETLNTYNNIPEYLKTFDVDEREMRKYIIGTISRLDTPYSTSIKGEIATARYLKNINYEELQKERIEILNSNRQDIRNATRLMKDILKKNYLCVLGNENKISDNKEIFNNLVNLFD